MYASRELFSFNESTLELNSNHLYPNTMRWLSKFVCQTFLYRFPFPTVIKYKHIYLYRSFLDQIKQRFLFQMSRWLVLEYWDNSQASNISQRTWVVSCLYLLMVYILTMQSQWFSIYLNVTSWYSSKRISCSCIHSLRYVSTEKSESCWHKLRVTRFSHVETSTNITSIITSIDLSSPNILS